MHNSNITLVAFLVLRNSRIAQRGHTTDDYQQLATKLIRRYNLQKIVDDTSVQIILTEHYSDFFIRDLTLLRMSWSLAAPSRYGTLSLHPSRKTYVMGFCSMYRRMLPD